MCPESGQLSPNDTTINGNLIRNKDRHGLPNVGAKSSNEDSRSVSSAKSEEKRKRVTGKSDESISKIGINYSGEVSGRKKSGREGTSLIPGRGISKLAESASSTKTLETVASGGEHSLVQADVPASVNEGPRRSRRITDTPKIPDAPRTVSDGGLSGVTPMIKEKLAEIGLRHVPVAAQGNCFFLAASYGLHKKTSKFLEVRRAGAKYVEDNREELKDQVMEGECEETIASLRTMNAHVDDLGIAAVSLAYARPVEIWQRTPDGDGI